MRAFVSGIVAAIAMLAVIVSSSEADARQTPPPASSARPVAPPALEVYGRLPAVSDVTLSASGNRDAFVASDGTTRRLYVRDATAGRVLVNVPVGDAKIAYLEFAGDRYLAMAYTVTANLAYGIREREVRQILIFDLERGTTKTVFEKGWASNLVNSDYGYFEEGGRWYGYYETFRTSAGALEDYVLAKVDLETGQYEAVLAHPREYESDYVLGADARVVAMSRPYPAERRWKVHLGETMRGAVIADLPLTDTVSWMVGLGFTPDALIYATRPEDDGDAVRYFEVRMAPGAQPQEITAEGGVRGIVYDPLSRLAVGVRDESRRIVFRDPTWAARWGALKRAFPDSMMTLESWSQRMNQAAVFTDGDGDAGTWWRVDLTTGASQVYGYAYPIEPEQVGRISTFKYKAADGLEIEAILTLPPGSDGRNLPVVVMPHGGPAARDWPVFDWWAQALASRGYAVVQPNFRGSTGYGEAFERAGWGEWGGKMQTDLSDAIAHLAREGVVDPARACIVGASYGGYAALAGVTLQRGVYRCAVAFAPVTDLPAMQDHLTRRDLGGELGRVKYWRDLMGRQTNTSEISPARQAARADAPILLIHGQADIVVPFRQSELMHDALRRAGKPVEFVRLPGDDHWLTREAGRIATLQASVAFVEKHNPAR